MSREWGSVHCEGERSRSAVLSWFRPFVPEAWGLPIKCDLQTEIETDRETAMRALFRLPDGRLKEAYRRNGARSTTVGTRDASPGILRGFRLHPAENSGGSQASPAKSDALSPSEGGR